MKLHHTRGNRGGNIPVNVVYFMFYESHSKHIDGLVQERRNSSALAMELRLACTNPSIYCFAICYALQFYTKQLEYKLRVFSMHWKSFANYDFIEYL